MPEQISRVISGQAPSLLDANIANQLIDTINGLMTSEGKSPIKMTVEDGGKIIVELDEEFSGVPDGFDEETLDIVQDDNTAGQRVFLTKAV